jgi:hypothetical protein
MESYNIGGGRALRIAVGMVMLAFILLAGSADAKTLTVNASGGADYKGITSISTYTHAKLSNIFVC